MHIARPHGLVWLTTKWTQSSTPANCRRIDKETAQQLDAATQAAEAASPHLHAVARQAAANAVAEVQSAAALQEVMAGRLEAGPLPTIEELSTAIHAAARFPNLKVSFEFPSVKPPCHEGRCQCLTTVCKHCLTLCASS